MRYLWNSNRCCEYSFGNWTSSFYNNLRVQRTNYFIESIMFTCLCSRSLSNFLRGLSNLVVFGRCDWLFQRWRNMRSKLKITYLAFYFVCFFVLFSISCYYFWQYFQWDTNFFNRSAERILLNLKFDNTDLFIKLFILSLIILNLLIRLT